MTVSHLCPLTCDDAGEGAAHSHRGERRGGSAEGRHDGGGAAEGRECGSVTIVAVVVRLHGRGVTDAGGLGPVVAQVGVDGHDVAIFGPVLERRALVLFAPHTTHRQACEGRRRDNERRVGGATGRRRTRDMNNMNPVVKAIFTVKSILTNDLKMWSQLQP